MFGNLFSVLSEIIRQDVQAEINRYKSGAAKEQAMSKTKPVDWTKPIQTRDGRPARVLCTDRQGGQPVLVLVSFPGIEKMQYHNLDGSWSLPANIESGNDIINVPQKITGWVNCYPDFRCVLHESREEADSVAGADRIACIPVEFYEGEGLDKLDSE